MTKKTITKEEYYSLCGLHELAIQADRKLNEYQDAVIAILQETEDDGSPVSHPGSGWSGEFIFSPENTPVDKLLRVLKVKVDE